MASDVQALDPYAAVVAALQSSGVAAIDWTKSPYLDQVAEGALPDPMPYVRMTVEESTKHDTFDGAPNSTPYIEMFKFDIELVCLEPQVAVLGVPYQPTSIFWALDMLTKYPMSSTKGFNVSGFQVGGWTRKGWQKSLYPNQPRTPSGGRAFKCKAVYEMLVNANLPY